MALQAAILDCLSFDPFELFDDGCGSLELGFCGRHVFPFLVGTLVIAETQLLSIRPVKAAVGSRPVRGASYTETCGI